MLEHAVWLHFVQRGLQKALLVHVIIVIIGVGAELLSLLVKEVEVSGTLVNDIVFLKSCFNLIFIPLDISIPIIVLVILIILVIEGEVRLSGSILTFWINY